MSTHGRLEAQIVVPAGGWTFSASYAGGGYNPISTLAAANTYYLTDLLSAMQTALNAAHGTGWTVTCAMGEAGTGLVSIGKTGTTWGIQWSANGLKEFLGFTGDISGSAGQTSTGTSIADSIWLPGTPKSAPYKDANPGHYVTDKRHAIAPTGHVKTLYGNKFYLIPNVSWPTVSEAKARGITTRGSFERFWYYSQFGECAWHNPGSSIRYYPNADSSTKWTVRVPDISETAMSPVVDGWSGLYPVSIPRMIEQT